MTTLREAAALALEELERGLQFGSVTRAITALRTALTVPGNDYERGFVDGMSHQVKSSVDRAVNAMARKPLSDEEIEAIRQVDDCGEDAPEFTRIFRIAERAHGIGGEA